jgi:O-methyltransferase involved in polyketide biosynthesis
MYLDRPTNEALFTALASLAQPGSRVSATFSGGGGSAALPSRAVAWLVRSAWRLSGEPSERWGDAEAATEVLTAAGWSVEEVLPGPDLVARVDVPPPLRRAGVSPGAFVVTATRS